MSDKSRVRRFLFEKLSPLSESGGDDIIDYIMEYSDIVGFEPINAEFIIDVDGDIMMRVFAVHDSEQWHDVEIARIKVFARPASSFMRGGAYRILVIPMDDRFSGVENYIDMRRSEVERIKIASVSLPPNSQHKKRFL
jgi:hypothetical protein